jgi:hypothetical protein
MQKSVAGLVTVVVAALLSGGAAGAGEHLVGREAFAARLAAAAAQRDVDLAALERALDTPAARAAAARIGVDLHSVRGAAAHLSTAELADLASRARALDVDPGAGIDPDVRELLVIFLIVAIVILVLQAVD